MKKTQATSADPRTAELVSGYLDPPSRYLGKVGPFTVLLSSEPDDTGMHYEVFDLWHQPHDTALSPVRTARLTGAEGRALAAMLQGPG